MIIEAFTANNRAAAIRSSVICLIGSFVHLRFELADWFPVLPDKLKRYSSPIGSLVVFMPVSDCRSQKIPCKRKCTMWGRDEKLPRFYLRRKVSTKSDRCCLSGGDFCFQFVFFSTRLIHPCLPPQTWSVVFVIRSQDTIRRRCTPSMQIMLSGSFLFITIISAGKRLRSCL